MATKTMKKVTALMRRDRDGTWLVSFPEIPGAHTYGRSLSQLRRRIPEVLRLWDIHPGRVEVVEQIYLPEALKAAVERAWVSREELNGQTVKVQRDLKSTIDRLERSLGLGVRDTSDLLGLSFQRIHQLRKGTAQPRGDPGRRRLSTPRQLTSVLQSPAKRSAMRKPTSATKRRPN